MSQRSKTKILSFTVNEGPRKNEDFVMARDSIFKLSATDPDIDLNWNITFEISEIIDDLGDDRTSDFVKTEEDCISDARRCSTTFKKNTEIFAECCPENEPETCLTTNGRINFLTMKVKAKGQVKEKTTRKKSVKNC